MKVRRARRAPPSPTLPHELRGEGGNCSGSVAEGASRPAGALSPDGLFARSSQRPSTPPPTSGEGWGSRRFTALRLVWQFGEQIPRNHRRGCAQQHRSSPPLREERAGRGPGGGAPAGAVRCPSPSLILSVTQPPPGFFGGGGRGLRARWGRSRPRAEPGSPRSAVLPLSTRNEGGGGRGVGATAGAVRSPSPRPARPATQPPPGFIGGGGRGLRARWGRRQRAPNPGST
jgi:hypothetical protein